MLGDGPAISRCSRRSSRSEASCRRSSTSSSTPSSSRASRAEDALTEFFGTFFAAINVLAFLLQLLVVPRLLSRFGVGSGLVLLPLALTASSVAFLGWPVLLTALLLKTSDDGLSNSVHRASVEVLYLPISLAVKSRLKAWLDMFVERASRGLAGLILLGAGALSMSASQLSWIVLVLLLPWISLARRAPPGVRPHVSGLDRAARHRGLLLRASRPGEPLGAPPGALE